MPDLTRRRRLLVLAICCSSLFIVGLDNTIVNLALPASRRDLASSLSDRWVLDHSYHPARGDLTIGVHRR